MDYIMFLKLAGFTTLSVLILLGFYRYVNTRIFNKYFYVELVERYNLDKIYHIEITGRIIPKVAYLKIPYEKISTEIKSKAMMGVINNNNIYIELISPKDRRKVLYLIKKSYIKAVKPYIREVLSNSKDQIKLIKLSQRHRPKVSKIACNTCKYKVQCKIAFTACNYQREHNDTILNKGIRVDASITNNISKKKIHS